MSSRSLILRALLPLAFFSALPTLAEAQRQEETYVIVHGAWAGAWDWRDMESLLTTAGQRVYRVQLTGLGSRAHLASPEITLNTHILDVENAILWEELSDVVLVGHSYSGMVITGVADRIPTRLKRLVYLDAYVPESGENALDAADLDTTDAVVAPRLQALIRDDGFIHPAVVGPIPGNVPQSARTFTDRLVLHGSSSSVPATYILTVQSSAPSPDDFQKHADRAAARGWPVIKMEADHIPNRSDPEALLKVLLSIQ